MRHTDREASLFEEKVRAIKRKFTSFTHARKKA